jgi:hypothetical protein
MKSAFDCFQHAAKCEEMAAAAIDDANRTLLLATAAHWRALGEAAKSREQRDTNYDPPLKQTPRPAMRTVKPRLPTPLSSHEEIALRRLAHGSNVDSQMAGRLQDLALIQLTNRGYRLTPLGKIRYDALPKAPLLTGPRSIHAITGYIEDLIEKAQSRARAGSGPAESLPMLGSSDDEDDERKEHSAAR